MVRAWVLAAIIMVGASPALAVCRDAHGHFARCGSGAVESSPTRLPKPARMRAFRLSRSPRAHRPRAPRTVHLFSHRGGRRTF